eukprot:8673068-Karenia_brevis.AAC.1
MRMMMVMVMVMVMIMVMRMIVVMNVWVDANDKRELEVLARGLPVCHGIPVVIDVTMRAPPRANGERQPHAD